MTQKRKRYDRQFKVAAARLVLSGDMTVRELSEELAIKDSMLRRWAEKYKEMGKAAFPANGSPKLNKDYEIEKLPKQAFLSQDRT
jgi:transposase